MYTLRNTCTWLFWQENPQTSSAGRSRYLLSRQIPTQAVWDHNGWSPHSSIASHAPCNIKPRQSLQQTVTPADWRAQHSTVSNDPGQVVQTHIYIYRHVPLSANTTEWRQWSSVVGQQAGPGSNHSPALD